MKSYSLHSEEHRQSSLFDRILGSLSETILALESDQILQQMKNDSTLYDYKQSYILQLLSKELNYYEQFENLAQQNQDLKNNVESIENIMRDKEQQFKDALNNIQISANKCMEAKDLEIQTLTQKLKLNYNDKEKNQSDYQLLHKKNTHLSLLSKQYEQEIHIYQDQLSSMKTQFAQAQKSLHAAENNVSSSSYTHQSLLKDIRIQHRKQVEQYDYALKKIQSDMLVVKNQWQKKCTDIQKNLRNHYEHKMFEIEERKTRQMLKHIQQMKEGNQTIIVKTDDQLLQSKIALLKEQYEGEISQINNNLEQVENLYEDAKDELSFKNKEYQKVVKDMNQLQKRLKQTQISFKQIQQKQQKEHQKIRIIIRQHQKEKQTFDTQKKISKKQQQQLKSVISELEQKLSNYEEQRMPQLKSKAQNLQKNTSNLYEQLRKKQIMLQQNIRCKQQLTIKLKNVEKNIEENDHIREKQRLNLQKYQKQISELKRERQKKKLLFKDARQKLVIQVGNMRKNLKMLKNDTEFSLNHIRNSVLLSHTTEIFEYSKQFLKDYYEQKFKNKITGLLDEIEQTKQKQNAEFQQLLRQKANMKREVDQLSTSLVNRNRELDMMNKNCDELTRQLETVKIQMKQEFMREKQKYYKMEQIIIHNERQYHHNLEDAKQQIKDSVKKLSSKWVDQINRLQQQAKKKDFQFSKLSQRTNQLLKQYEQMLQKQPIFKQESRRYRKRYEEYKIKSEEQIEDLLQRLQRQSKHKLELEKQLRTIRVELNGYSFNNNEMGSRNKLTPNNANSDYLKSNFEMTPKQKQFSDLKQLVANTYEIYNGGKSKPEKDFTKKNYI